MLLFTQYETIRGLPLSVVSLFRCITCQDVCVQQSQAGRGIKRVWAPCSNLSSLGSNCPALKKVLVI